MPPAEPKRERRAGLTEDVDLAEPPGGRIIALAKVAAELVLWSRVAIGRRVAKARGRHRPLPDLVPPTAVLHHADEWKAAVAHAQERRLPLHHDRAKNWDALGAVGAILRLTPRSRWRELRVIDAGAARYSPILPWLRLYGLGDAPGSLLGLNLEFTSHRVRDGVQFRRGDATCTGLAAGSVDAITCMSVIEHGVTVDAFLTEAARVLRPGGLLVISTDYDHQPPATTGLVAYGKPVRVFGPDDIHALIKQADRVGLDLVGDVQTADLQNPERPVHWRRLNLNYTFILLTFRRR